MSQINWFWLSGSLINNLIEGNDVMLLLMSFMSHGLKLSIMIKFHRCNLCLLMHLCSGWSLLMFWVVISNLTSTTAGLMLYLWPVHSCPCFWFQPNTPPGKQTSIQLIDASVPLVCILSFNHYLSKVDPFLYHSIQRCCFSPDLHTQLQNIIHQLTWMDLFIS